jgi:hypothetical protein
MTSLIGFVSPVYSIQKNGVESLIAPSSADSGKYPAPVAFLNLSFPLRSSLPEEVPYEHVIFATGAALPDPEKPDFSLTDVPVFVPGWVA